MCSSGNPTWHRKSPRYYFKKAKTAPWNVSLRLICQLSVSPNHLRPAPGQPSTTGGCWRWHMLKAETNPECVCVICVTLDTHTRLCDFFLIHMKVCVCICLPACPYMFEYVERTLWLSLRVYVYVWTNGGGVLIDVDAAQTFLFKADVVRRTTSAVLSAPLWS